MKFQHGKQDISFGLKYLFTMSDTRLIDIFGQRTHFIKPFLPIKLVITVDTSMNST